MAKTFYQTKLELLENAHESLQALIDHEQKSDSPDSEEIKVYGGFQNTILNIYDGVELLRDEELNPKIRRAILEVIVEVPIQETFEQTILNQIFEKCPELKPLANRISLKSILDK